MQIFWLVIVFIFGNIKTSNNIIMKELYSFEQSTSYWLWHKFKQQTKIYQIENIKI